MIAMTRWGEWSEDEIDESWNPGKGKAMREFNNRTKKGRDQQWKGAEYTHGVDLCIGMPKV